MTKTEEVMVFEKDLPDNTTEIRVIVGEQVFKKAFESPVKPETTESFMLECFTSAFPDSIIESITEHGTHSVN